MADVDQPQYEHFVISVFDAKRQTWHRLRPRSVLSQYDSLEAAQRDASKFATETNKLHRVSRVVTSAISEHQPT